MVAHAISDIQPVVAELAQKYGAQRVYLFSSYARRDMNETSDVDLRIDKGNKEPGACLPSIGFGRYLGSFRGFDSHRVSGQRASSAIKDDEVLLYEAS